MLKEAYPLRIPPTWAGKTARVALRFLDEKRTPVAVTGTGATADGKMVVLGEAQVAP
jgi:hypothetical protein